MRTLVVVIGLALMTGCGSNPQVEPGTAGPSAQTGHEGSSASYAIVSRMSRSGGHGSSQNYQIQGAIQ